MYGQTDWVSEGSYKHSLYLKTYPIVIVRFVVREEIIEEDLTDSEAADTDEELARDAYRNLDLRYIGCPIILTRSVAMSFIVRLPFWQSLST